MRRLCTKHSYYAFCCYHCFILILVILFIDNGSFVVTTTTTTEESKTSSTDDAERNTSSSSSSSEQQQVKNNNKDYIVPKEEYPIQDYNFTGCLLNKKPRPIYNDTYWLHLQQLFDWMNNGEKGQYPTCDDILKLEKINNTKPQTGFQVPYKIIDFSSTSSQTATTTRKDNNNKGRGVIVATRKINVGDVVWKGEYTAIFFTESSYRDFLNLIVVTTLPGQVSFDLACDTIQWAYSDTTGGKLKPRNYVGLDLDHGSYMNHGDAKDTNVGCPTGGDTCAESGDVALRDIEIGEELLVDYNRFYKIGLLPWFENLVRLARTTPRNKQNDDVSSTTINDNEQQSNSNGNSDDPPGGGDGELVVVGAVENNNKKDSNNKEDCEFDSNFELRCAVIKEDDDDDDDDDDEEESVNNLSSAAEL